MINRWIPQRHVNTVDEIDIELTTKFLEVDFSALPSLETVKTEFIQPKTEVLLKMLENGEIDTSVLDQIFQWEDDYYEYLKVREAYHIIMTYSQAEYSALQTGEIRDICEDIMSYISVGNNGRVMAQAPQSLYHFDKMTIGDFVCIDFHFFEKAIKIQKLEHSF